MKVTAVEILQPCKTTYEIANDIKGVKKGEWYWSEFQSSKGTSHYLLHVMEQDQFLVLWAINPKVMTKAELNSAFDTDQLWYEVDRETIEHRFSKQGVRK